MPRGPLTARRSWAAAAVLAALILAALAPLPGGPPPAHAHASYERSEPAFAAELTQSPSRIDIWFSQQLFRQQGANTFLLREINPALAEAHTPAAEVGVITSGELTLDDDDRFHAFAVLHVELPEGRYRVEWTSLSADDGDASSGRFVFYVVRAATAAEVAEDRALAAELFVPYPGDETDAAATDAPPPPRPPALRDEEAESGLDATVLAIAAAGLVAIVGLVVFRGRGGTP